MDKRLQIKNIAISASNLKLIGAIDEFKGQWRATQHLGPDRLVSLKHTATIASIASSMRIEGAVLSDLEVEKLLSTPAQASLVTRDEQEVAGHAEAMATVLENYAQMEPTENHIKQLHGILLKHSTKDTRHRGSYKKIVNHIEAFGPDKNSLGVLLKTTTPFETPLWMQGLTQWYQVQEQEQTQHPLILIALFVAVFLKIHPFQDGNGRLSRILTTWLLLRAGYSYVEYSSMDRLIEANKEHYYRALLLTQKTILSVKGQNWEPWLNFFLKTMLQQVDSLKSQMEQPSNAALPALSRSILNAAQKYGEICISDIEPITQAKRSTIKAHLKKLVKQNHLQLVGKGRGARYIIKLKD